MCFAIQTVSLENGARLGIAALPGRGGNGLEDLHTIADWHPAIVVSMTEAAEMERHNMGDLGGMLHQRGIDWAHFPMRDFGTPDGQGWSGLSRRLHAVLARKGAVLAHCYGGQGRSGMVLLRLMVERGIAPATALARLRAIRPGAVETDAQYRWATQGTENG